MRTSEVRHNRPVIPVDVLDAIVKFKISPKTTRDPKTAAVSTTLPSTSFPVAFVLEHQPWL